MQPPGLCLGLMSGTSLDGIDAALIEHRDGVPGLLAHRWQPWPSGLRARLLAAATDGCNLEMLGRLDAETAQQFAAAAAALLDAHGTPASAVRVIGSHGQTLHHAPGDQPPHTLQIGDPAVIAVATGIDVVADFRRMDVALGGEGAPLAPIFHRDCFGGVGHARAVLNLGGIANLTLLPAAGRGPVTGFDTGPANGLLDAWIQQQRGCARDEDGAWAASGSVDGSLLAALLGDPWFSAPPPKSTGREQFNLAWLRGRADPAALPPQDVQATLLALTVESVARALEGHAPEVHEVLICGGGTRNGALVRALATRLGPRRVQSTAAWGWPPEAIEAAAFAHLAWLHLEGRPGNLPTVTGACRAAVLGQRTQAPPRA